MSNSEFSTQLNSPVAAVLNRSVAWPDSSTSPSKTTLPPAKVSSSPIFRSQSTTQLPGGTTTISLFLMVQG